MDFDRIGSKISGKKFFYSLLLGGIFLISLGTNCSAQSAKDKDSSKANTKATTSAPAQTTEDSTSSGAATTTKPTPTNNDGMVRKLNLTLEESLKSNKKFVSTGDIKFAFPADWTATFKSERIAGVDSVTTTVKTKQRGKAYCSLTLMNDSFNQADRDAMLNAFVDRLKFNGERKVSKKQNGKLGKDAKFDVIYKVLNGTMTTKKKQKMDYQVKVAVLSIPKSKKTVMASFFMEMPAPAKYRSGIAMIQHSIDYATMVESTDSGDEAASADKSSAGAG